MFARRYFWRFADKINVPRHDPIMLAKKCITADQSEKARKSISQWQEEELQSQDPVPAFGTSGELL